MIFSIPTIISLIGGLAPTIVKAMTGGGTWAERAEGLLVQFIDKLGGPETDSEMDYEVRLRELSYEHKEELKRIDFVFKTEIENNRHELNMLIATEQSKLVGSDSRSKDKVRKYWRPAVAWTCVIGLFIHVLGTWFLGLTIGLLVVNGVVSPMAANDFIIYVPEMDTSLVLSLIVPLLGLGAYRSYEKKNQID